MVKIVKANNFKSSWETDADSGTEIYVMLWCWRQITTPDGLFWMVLQSESRIVDEKCLIIQSVFNHILWNLVVSMTQPYRKQEWTSGKLCQVWYCQTCEHVCHRIMCFVIQRWTEMNGIHQFRGIDLGIWSRLPETPTAPVTWLAGCRLSRQPLMMRSLKDENGDGWCGWG